MAGNEDRPRLPQRRGRKAPGDLPDGFEPIVPLFRRRKAPAPADTSPPRPLPRSATPPTRPAAPPRALPEPEPAPVMAEPPPRDRSHARLLAVLVAVLLAFLAVLAIALLG